MGGAQDMAGGGRTGRELEISPLNCCSARRNSSVTLSNLRRAWNTVFVSDDEDRVREGQQLGAHQ